MPIKILQLPYYKADSLLSMNPKLRKKGERKQKYYVQQSDKSYLIETRNVLIWRKVFPLAWKERDQKDLKRSENLHLNHQQQQTKDWLQTTKPLWCFRGKAQL